MTYPVRALACTAAVALAAACHQDGGGPPAARAQISARKTADMLHAVLEADRAAYTRNVVNRLTKEQVVTTLDPVTREPDQLAASERWKSEHGRLPLPAQMFRAGATNVAERQIGLHYALLSQWPISDHNAPKTRVERRGLANIADDREPFYGSESLGGTRYLTAIYPDVAVADACVDCHNEHPHSPRRDFEVGDVMGAVVIRVALTE